jgi:multicomponent Na+:H+ antiporter subunit D
VIVGPILVGWAGALAFMLLDGRRRSVGLAALGTLAVVFALTVRLAVAVWSHGPVRVTTGGWPEGLGITLAADPLGVAFAIVAQLCLMAALGYHVVARVEAHRLPGLILFMATGLTGLFLTADVFNFYVCFEIAMASAFAMTAHSRGRQGVSAGFLFVTLNLFGSALFLMAVGGLYRLTGTLLFDGVAAGLAGSETPRTAGVGALLLAAFSLKLGLFPFHTWLPDVYRESRPEVAAIFSGALATVGSYGLLRFGAGLMPAEVIHGAPVLATLGAASILYGGVAAIRAPSVQGTLAWSAVGQAGYVLVALAFHTPAALAAATIYALVNAATKTLLFLATGVRGGASAAAFAAGAFSLAGVPPFVGFVAKAAMFRSAADAGSWGLLAVLLAGSGLSFVYVFLAFQRRYWTLAAAEPPSAATGGPLVVGYALLLLATGIWPSPLIDAALSAAAALGGSR